VGGWDDKVVGRTVGPIRCAQGRLSDGQKLVEEFCPVGYDKFSICSATELPLGLAIGVSVDDDDGAIVGLAARFGLRELRRVERAVTAATNNDDVPQRISLPPSTTRIVPVT
jgi:hypothetical protein